ncbi:MAG: MBL fold metallo-hydrolase [Gammaproteobacteria bacterium]|nr:MBL fold metallo-hydrolase [Gammaproteobacteria bacterium]
MKEAVAAVFVHGDEVFLIRRQGHLRAFPGYYAFPGGKVDREDSTGVVDHPLLLAHPPAHMAALLRELSEELGYDLQQGLVREEIGAIHLLGTAITPAFETIRFRAHHFKIVLNQRPVFSPDSQEIAFSEWVHREELWSRFCRGEGPMVVPTINLIRALARDSAVEQVEPFNLDYDESRKLPCLELIRGLKYIPVPSRTLPPARFTNALIIGDGGKDAPVCLVDPSPKSEVVYRKLVHTLEDGKPDLILFSHHHPDHHQFAPDLARLLGVPVACTQETEQYLERAQGSDYLQGIDIHHLKGGECITRWLGRKVLCHGLPGHDRGMIGLAPEDLAWFFVGDLIQTEGTVVIPEPEGDMSVYFESLEKLIDLAPKAIIPSHGMPAGGVHLLRRTLDHRRMREDQIRSLLRAGHSHQEMLEAIYQELDGRLIPLALQNIRQHVKKLVLEEG